MSLALDFEPHSWYMGFAIKRIDTADEEGKPFTTWDAYIDNGMTYQVDDVQADTLRELKKLIRDYHRLTGGVTI